MKNKLFAAALAALTLVGVTGVAAAQDYRGGYSERRGQDGYDDRRYRATITVRDHGRVMFFDRDDRLFHRMLRSPCRVQPGLVYVYTDQCRRDGQCRVMVYARHRDYPVDRLWAPPIRRWSDRNAYWQRDWDWDRDWDTDNRSGQYRDHRQYREGDDYRLEGGIGQPRR